MNEAALIEVQELRTRIAELQRIAAEYDAKYRDLVEQLPAIRKAEQELRQKEVLQNEILSRLVTRLAASADVKNMVEVVEAGTGELLGWDAHYFAVKRPHENAFRVLHTVDTVDGEKRVYLEDSWEITDFSQSLDLLLEGQPRLCNRAPGVAQPAYTRFGDRSRSSASLMFVPIRSGRDVIGILSAQSYTHFRYGEADLSLFQRVADLVAPALERAYAEEALRRAHGELEARVAERTADLARANELLVAEMAERKHVEAQLWQAQKMEAVGRLSGGIAHDFNNLLTVILGNAQIALMTLQAETGGREPVKVVDALEEIEQAARRAALLTSRLLTFSRKQVSHPHILDAGALVRGIEGMLRRLIREDIALEIDCRPGEHLIHADATQIEQALLNLAVNAVDAMPQGGRLSIEIRDVVLDAAPSGQYGEAATGPHVLIEVCDTGVGMDQDTLAHLFEPFFTTKPFGQGTGLGLATGYGIVKQSGGHITVESQPGRGSTFRLYFPAARGEAPRPAPPPRPQWEAGRAKILLCEDEDSLRRLACAVLTECGYSVIDASSGEAALRRAAECEDPIHLLITDLVMPGMRGDSVAAALQKDRPEMKALFMSGYASDSLRAESLAQGRFEFLQKPFTPEVLLSRVRDVLGKVESGAADITA